MPLQKIYLQKKGSGYANKFVYEIVTMDKGDEKNLTNYRYFSSFSFIYIHRYIQIHTRLNLSS